MAARRDAIGRTWPSSEYEIGLEKVREFARAVGEDNPVHLDRGAAREAGYRDVVAPPMFAVVYSGPALGPALFDPEVGMDFSRMVHGSQEFIWGEPVCVGDVITTSAELVDISEKGSLTFYVFRTESRNQSGDEVVRATWTDIVRGE